jgi:hypothetical protein
MLQYVWDQHFLINTFLASSNIIPKSYNIFCSFQHFFASSNMLQNVWTFLEKIFQHFSFCSSSTSKRPAAAAPRPADTHRHRHLCRGGATLPKQQRDELTCDRHEAAWSGKLARGRRGATRLSDLVRSGEPRNNRSEARGGLVRQGTTTRPPPAGTGGREVGGSEGGRS